MEKPKNMEYNLLRECGNCKNVDRYPLSKTDAAFNLYNNSQLYNAVCSKCGSIKLGNLTHPMKKVDQELLDTWGYNTKLFFIEQDEDVILADIKNLPLFLKAIDANVYLKSKIDILVASLCILLYDVLVSPEEYTEKENAGRRKIADKIIPELVKRKQRVFEAEDILMDYIKELVFPALDIRASLKTQ